MEPGSNKSVTKYSRRCLYITYLIVSFLHDSYKIISACFLPRCCRFYPSCSDYTKEAIIKHGLIKGLYIGLCRLSRCSPVSKGSGGYDPVP